MSIEPLITFKAGVCALDVSANPIDVLISYVLMIL